MFIHDNQQQLDLQQSRYSFNDQMLANLPNRQLDRFIPHRNHTNAIHPDSLLSFDQYTPETQYSHLIKKRLFQNHNTKLINFNQKQTKQPPSLPILPPSHLNQLNPKVQSPSKILDIPKFKDDFYLNNIDWSDRGPLAIALDTETFLYTPQNLIQIGKAPFSSYVSSLKIEDCILSVGLSNGMIQIYDLQKNNLVRTLSNHQNRVSALTYIDTLLVSGSKDKSILINDLRIYNNKVKEWIEHKGEVCSLKTKNKNEKIFASGSSDGSAIIWDINYGHKGAVKALDWCPWKNGLLATGGGNNTQKTIKIWNTINSKMIACQAIDDQVSGLLWNQELKMLTSSHGYCKNQIMFWSMEVNNSYGCQLVNRKVWKAHQRRVLNMAYSYDQKYLCTVGADQNMKFWCVKQGDSNPFNRNERSLRDDQYFRV